MAGLAVSEDRKKVVRARNDIANDGQMLDEFVQLEAERVVTEVLQEES